MRTMKWSTPSRYCLGEACAHDLYLPLWLEQRQSASQAPDPFIFIACEICGTK